MWKVLENLKDDLNMIVYQTEFIYDKSFMLGIMDPSAADLPPFKY